MFSNNLRNTIVASITLLSTGIIFTFIVPTGVFGPLLIGFGIGFGLSIMEKLEKLKEVRYERFV